jgi:hypothetical protein
MDNSNDGSNDDPNDGSQPTKSRVVGDRAFRSTKIRSTTQNAPSQFRATTTCTVVRTSPNKIKEYRSTTTPLLTRSDVGRSDGAGPTPSVCPVVIVGAVIVEVDA